MPMLRMAEDLVTTPVAVGLAPMLARVHTAWRGVTAGNRRTANNCDVLDLDRPGDWITVRFERSQSESGATNSL